jgi:hypothetical protein
MSASRAIVIGVLLKAPEAKTGKAGKRYCVTTVRKGTGECVRWWKVLAYNESAIEDLPQLRNSEQVSIAGEAGRSDCTLHLLERGGL